MSLYAVYYSDTAYEDLRSIHHYIMDELQAPMAAQNQIRRIRDAAQKLESFPQKHELIPWASGALRGLRKLPIDNYVIFYLIEEANASVQIIRIIYGGRNLRKQFIN